MEEEKPMTQTERTKWLQVINFIDIALLTILIVLVVYAWWTGQFCNCTCLYGRVTEQALNLTGTPFIIQ